MPYQVNWLVEKHVVEIKLIGLFTVSELKEVDEAALGLVKQYPDNTIHLFFDLTTMTYSPPLSALRGVQLLRQPNVGWAANYGTFNPLFRVLTTPLTKLFGLKQRFFNSRD